MAGAAVRVGTGSTITFGTAAWTAQIMSMSWSGISRPSIDTSHMGTRGTATITTNASTFGYATSVPGDISDPGELTLEVHFDPDHHVPIDQPAETITLTFDKVAGDTTASSWAGTGYMTSFEFSDPLEDKMTGTATVKFSGTITRTAAT